MKPTEVSSIEIDAVCRTIQQLLFDFPSHSRSLLSHLETCIGGNGNLLLENVSEICLTREMVSLITRMLGNEDCGKTVLCSKRVTDGVFAEQISEQLTRDGT